MAVRAPFRSLMTQLYTRPELGKRLSGSTMSVAVNLPFCTHSKNEGKGFE